MGTLSLREQTPFSANGKGYVGIFGTIFGLFGREGESLLSKLFRHYLLVFFKRRGLSFEWKKWNFLSTIFFALLEGEESPLCVNGKGCVGTKLTAGV